jgi:DNA-binding CsgD family transcriptional regulator
VVPLEGTGHAAYARLSIVDPDAGPVIAADTLAQMFGLTPAQAQLAHRLALGDSQAQAAQHLDIQVATARAQLTAIYRKTETQNLAALTRLLALLSAAGVVRDSSQTAALTHDAPLNRAQHTKSPKMLRKT